MQASYTAALFLRGMPLMPNSPDISLHFAPRRCHSHLHCPFCSSLASEHISKVTKARHFQYSGVFQGNPVVYIGVSFAITSPDTAGHLKFVAPVTLGKPEHLP